MTRADPGGRGAAGGAEKGSAAGWRGMPGWLNLHRSQPPLYIRPDHLVSQLPRMISRRFLDL
jgi:hypothetical protein